MTFDFKTFGAETLTASDLNSQFSKIESKFGNIVNADIAATAGITSQKLSDRYGTSYLTMLLTPRIWGDTGTSAGAAFDDQATEGSIPMARIYPEFPGKRAYLVSVSAYCADYANSSSGDPGIIYVYHNATQINSMTGFASNAFQSIRAGSGSSAFSSPIAALSSGDYLGIRLGKSADTDSTYPSASSISITFTFKVELTS